MPIIFHECHAYTKVSTSIRINWLSTHPCTLLPMGLVSILQSLVAAWQTGFHRGAYLLFFEQLYSLGVFRSFENQSKFLK